MTLLLAVDPGTKESAWLLYDVDSKAPVEWGKEPNEDLRRRLIRYATDGSCDVLAVEMVASYGMAVGREVFETVLWIGRFIELWDGDHALVYRADVKLHLTNSRRSKDPHVRQALLDRYGPGKDIAIGRKAAPGPLYGLTGDCWSALAIAVTHADTALA